MVQPLVAALLALTFQQGDGSTYKDRATEQLVARAQARHAVQDTLVHDYTALVRTRLDAGFGKRRFAIIPPFVATETAARLTWERPNNLKVDIVGARAASSIRGVKVSSTFNDPWFIPRGLGDSIRFLDELPETGALHPLSAQGPEHYRYTITDSLTITLPERTVRAVGLRVEPKHLAPSLVAGNIWLDAETFEVVRMTIVFVGQFLWATPDSATAVDTAKAINDNKWANRIVKIEAELEYGLHESRYWMPYRQLVTLTMEIPWFISARIPVHFLSTFSEYRINTGATPLFTIAPDTVKPPEDSTRRWARCRDEDSTRTDCPAGYRNRRDRIEKGYTRAEKFETGGRWEITVPPRNSLTSYAWPDELKLAPDPAAEEMIRETAATLATIGSRLPGAWVGRQNLGLMWERFSDLWRFNRVQGASVGAGFRLQPGAFTSVLGAWRFGFSDHRVTGSLTLRRDGPAGRLDLGAWRDVREFELWTMGLTTGNSFNALLAGHDDADYYISQGAGLAFAANRGLLRDFELSAGYERHRTMLRATHSALNDVLGGTGVFQVNPFVSAGDFVRLAATRPWRTGPASFTVGADALLNPDSKGVRGFASAKLPFALAGRSGALSLKAAGMAGDLISQLQSRVGGPQTVRGYDYGTRSGPGMWAAQLDFGVSRRSAVSPVLFADVGNIIRWGGAGDPLVGVGAGLSFFSGIMRFNVAKGLNPDTPVRFDLLFRAPR
ncbi:MAG: hypothetical protein EXR93_03875 [Gemmatimonadetes bacterium]|nr:hypothetical protein [Gemmatimonadota bacterium]